MRLDQAGSSGTAKRRDLKVAEFSRALIRRGGSGARSVSGAPDIENRLGRLAENHTGSARKAIARDVITRK
jgi:hypothetical protein